MSFLPSVSRRRLLQGSAALLTIAHPGLSFARTGGDQRLVLIILRGGMDGLAAVPPYGDRDYRGLRGALALPDPASDGGILDLDGFFGLHPALAPLLPGYRAGELAVLHAAATPYRDRSHFDAQDLLENGTTVPHGMATGWLNRAVGALADSYGHGDRRLGLAIGQGVPLVLRGPAGVTAWAPSPLREADEDFLARVGQLYQGDPLLADALAAGIASAHMAAHDAPATEDDMAPTEAPNGDKRDGGQRGGGQRGARLTPALMGEMAGRLLADPDGPRVATLDLGGWDTHVAQGTVAGRLGGALGALATTLSALQTALGADWRRTAVAVVTEFGRTARPNGTGGTDHGTATAAFLAGGAIQGGRVIHDWPGLADGRLYQGRDLAPTLDLRAAMKTLLHQHLGLSLATIEENVFPGSAGVAPLPDLIRV